MVKVGAREYGYSLVEFNSSDKRTKADLVVIKRASLTQGIGKRKLLLLDEVDGFTKVGMVELIKILDETNCPIVLTANNKSKLNTLKGKCYFIACPRIPDLGIMNILKVIVKYKEINVHLRVLSEITLKSKGDARHALTELEKVVGIDAKKALQLIEGKDEDVSIEMFVEKLFTSDIEDIEQSNNKIKFSDIEFIINIFVENLPDIIKDVSLLDSYYRVLGNMDLTMQRIKRKQKYKLLRNIYLHFSHVIPLMRKSKDFKVVSLSAPSYLPYIYERRKKISIAEKLGKIYNCSRRTILTNFIIYKKLLRNKENLSHAIVNAKLDKKDVDYLFGERAVEEFESYFVTESKTSRAVKLTDMSIETSRKRKKKQKVVKKKKESLPTKGNLSNWM